MACLPSFLLRDPPVCRRHQVKVAQSPSRSFYSLPSFSLVFSGYHIVSYRILVCVCVCVRGSSGRQCRKLASLL